MKIVFDTNFRIDYLKGMTNTTQTESIEKLAARKGVRANAVINFLSTLDGQTASEAFSNLRQDTRDYKWNAATVTAISDGIRMRFSR